MSSPANRGVVFRGAGKVAVESIPFPELAANAITASSSRS